MARTIDFGGRGGRAHTLPWVRRLVIAVAGAIAVVVSASVAHAADRVVRLSEIAERFGLADVRHHVISGRRVLSDGRNRLAVVPGGSLLVINNAFLPLTRQVGCHEGDLLIPEDALPFIESHLVPRPVVATKPAKIAAPAPRPKPTPVAPRVQVMRPKAGRIVLDPGHGGKFTGARGAGGLLEKDVNLAITLHLKAILEERGWKVTLTRGDDRVLANDLNQDLNARADIANRADADLFVSVHANYAASRDVSGFEVYYHKNARSRDLARAVHGAMREQVDDDDRGVKTAGFRVIKRATPPSVLVEVGFVSHPATEKKLRTDAYRQSLARAIADGIDRSGLGSGR